jgi:hypothetical protein
MKEYRFDKMEGVASFLCVFPTSLVLLGRRLRVGFDTVLCRISPVVWVVDKVKPIMRTGKWLTRHRCQRKTHIGKTPSKYGVGRVSIELGKGIRNGSKRRDALNLSCEKAELLYAAFWIHCG